MRKHTSNQHNRDEKDERKILGIMMTRKKLITLGVTGIAALGLAGGATAYMIGDKPTDTATPATSKTTTPGGKKIEKSLTSKDGKKDTKESDKPTEKSDESKSDTADKDSKESKTDTKKGTDSKNDKGASDSKKSGSSEGGSKSGDSKSGGKSSGGSSSGSGGSGGSKTSGNSGGSKSSGGGKSSGGSTQPTHTHVYNIPITQTKTIHHDAVYKTVHHDAVEESYNACNICGRDITGHEAEHAQEHFFNDGRPGGHHTAYRTARAAYDEQVLVSKAWDEQQTVTVGYKCSCGAQK